MMISNNIPLVDWASGTFFLVAFLAISAIMIIVVLNMMKSQDKKEED
ncbi:MAG: hypothetical protein AAFP76_03925 [Bacteroidota bacterium]